MKLDSLTGDEILAVHDALSFLIRSRRIDRSDPDVAPLVSAVGKLKRAFPSRICTHCKERTTRRSNGFCDADNAYLNKHGVLPPKEVLDRRTA